MKANAMYKDALRWISIRKNVGILTALWLILLLLTLFDGCIAKVRQPMNLFYITAGQTIPIDGNIDERVEDHTQLGYRISSQYLTLQIEAVQRGYWLGGNMWIGRLSAAPEASEGEYTIWIFNRKNDRNLQTVPHRVIVYKTKEALHRQSLSIIESKFSLSPWIAALFCLPIAIILVAVSYWISCKIENVLNTHFIKEIYKILPSEDQSLIVSFEFGEQDGLSVGDKVTILDDRLDVVGDAVVIEVDKKDSSAKTSATDPSVYVLWKRG